MARLDIGTARYRHSDDSPERISYLEWESDVGTFDIIMVSRKKDFLHVAGRMFYGRGPREQYDLKAIDGATIELTHRVNGEVIVFRKCSDSELMNAP